MNKTIGLVFADSMEYAPFLSFAKENGGKEEIFRKNNSVTVTMGENDRTLTLVAIECGIGKVNAASATAYLIGEKKADYILNAGLSGAVSELKREDMVAGESYVECDFDLSAIGYKQGEKPDGEKYIFDSDERLLSYALQSDGVLSAKLGTGDIFLTDKVKKNFFKDTFGIKAFDMETGAIASVCHKSDIPMLSLRKISDDADDSSAEDYREMNKRQEKCLTDLLVNVCKRLLRDDSQWTF